MPDSKPSARPAPLGALHRDAVAEFSIGTIGFAVACVVLLVGRHRFAVPDWWLQVCATGLVIGCVATGYCRWRRDKRARDAARGIPAPTA